MPKKQPPYCQAWTPTPTGDGGRFYCIQPEGHGGQHVSPTSNPGAVRHDLEWVIYGTSEGQEIVDIRASLAAEKGRADKIGRENVALREVVKAARNVVKHLVPLRLTPPVSLARHHRTCAEAYDPDAECPIKMGEAGVQDLVKLLAELDAGEAR